jgi:hypothetical protein
VIKDDLCYVFDTDDPATPADFEANFGRGVEEGDSQFFM